MDPWLSARMALAVRPPEPSRLYPSVGLSRTDAGVPQQLLDRAQVRAALEQVRRVRVAEGVWGDAGPRNRELARGAQAAPDVRGRQPPPAAREEERRLGAVVRGRRGKSGPGVGQVAVERAPRGLAGGDDARLPTFAGHAQLLGVRIEIRHVEVHDLLGSEAGGVGELEHRAIAEGKRLARRYRVEQPGHLVGPEDARQVGVALRRGDEGRRTRLDLAALEQVAVEAADRRELPRDRPPRKPAPGQPSRAPP